MAKPLIVGLDIGTTTGISIHDLKKNLLYLKSKKHFSTSNIIKQIMIFGTPLIVATDKKNLPDKIRKIASAFNSKVFFPDHDLTVQEKENIVNISMKDDHERDALAASLFAFKVYSAQFYNVDNSLDALGLSKHSDRVKEMIVRKEAKNIAEAIDKMRPKEKLEEKTFKEEPKRDDREIIEELNKKLREERNRNEIVKAYTEKIENRVRNLEVQKQEYIEEQMKKTEEARKQILKDKEMRSRDILIKQLKFELNKERSIKQAFEEKQRIEDELTSIEKEKKIPVVIIENFDKEDIVNANRQFQISNRVVWIKNFKFSRVTAKILASIKPKIVIGEVDKEIKEFLNESKIIVVDTIKPEIRDYYAAVSPGDIENEIKKIEKKNFLKWLEDYRDRS